MTPFQRRALSATPADDAFDAPLPYPAGWFSLGFSREIKPGGVLTRRLAEADVVLYRSRGGALRVVQPYCPHLGAHLGIAGKVAGEELVCSFHNFAYDEEGRCVRSGYGTRPPRARLRTFPVREVAGVVFVWYSPDGSGPAWWLPELSSAGFPRTSFRFTELPGHPQEVIENSVDLGHLSEFHRFTGIEIVEPISFDGPSFTVRYRWRQRFPLLGTRTVEYQTDIHGLGYILVTADLPALGLRARLWALPTPVAPWRIHFRFAASISVGSKDTRLTSGLSSILTAAAAGVVAPEASRDIPIWSYKNYVEPPRLAKGDGPIGPFRRWAKQFYPISQREEVP
jgi:nitrite reductase/ring-hydroxylating ferredoxin subunit